MVVDPEAVVQRQLEAYNAHDLEGFVAQYSDDIRIFRPPLLEPALVGKAAFKHFYATQRFNHAGLHAQLLNRMVLGATVIDHERIVGVREQPFEVAVVYQAVNGLILNSWAFAA
jgi:hypothetical protein